MITIYNLCNTINKKPYVGQTWNTTKGRANGRGSGYKECPKLYNAIRKHGWDNFYYEVLAIAYTQEDADNLEDFFIKHLDSINNGYNLKEGGAIGKHSEEAKRKISERQMGRKLSQETKDKISKSHKGLPVSQDRRERTSKTLKGRKISPEVLAKRSTKGEDNNFYGKHHTEETRIKISSTKALNKLIKIWRN